jgi:hypothetical protein
LVVKYHVVGRSLRWVSIESVNTTIKLGRGEGRGISCLETPILAYNVLGSKNWKYQKKKSKSPVLKILKIATH